MQAYIYALFFKYCYIKIYLNLPGGLGGISGNWQVS